MIFIRARLGYYRFRQSTMLNFAANIAKRHWFAYAVIFGHMAYFGSYRSGLVMKKQVETVEPRSRSLWKTFDQGFREFLKYQMYDNLFSNTWIDNRTAQALWDLTQVPKYQTLITDLFLLMYQQKGFCDDTQHLTLKIVNDYLSSDFATGNLADIAVRAALRDTVNVLPALQFQLMSFL